MNTKKQKKGFTLVEVLIYTAILGISSALLSGVLLNTTKIKSRQTAVIEVNEQLNFVLQNIQRSIADSSVIDIENGISTSTLNLRFKTEANNPTNAILVTKFYISEGKVYKKEGSADAQPLTNDSVIADAINFLKISGYSGHDSVQVDLTLSYNTQNPASAFSRTLSSAIARVSAATFDSNLIPGSSIYDIGTTASPWKDLYVSGKVGIGTTNPSYSLDTTGALRLEPMAAPTAAKGVMYFDSTLNKFKCSSDGSTFAGCGVPSLTLGNTFVGDANGAAVATSTINISTAGNVGIRRTPGSVGGSDVALDIAGKARITSAVDNGMMLTAAGQSDYVAYITASGETTNYGLAIWAGDGVSNSVNILDVADHSGNSKMLVKNSGNVGIGTTAPTARLYLKTTDTSTVPLQVEISTGSSAWLYKKPITINNTSNSNTLTNYQVIITLDTATLVNAGKMLSNGNDIRFFDTNETTALDYWIESGINTASTRIWVEVPSITGSSNKTIYLYYGNSGAASTSNGVNTFDLFDDFDTWDTAKWNSDTTPTVANSIITIPSGYKIYSKTSFSYNTAMTWNANAPSTNYSALGYGDTSAAFLGFYTNYNGSANGQHNADNRLNPSTNTYSAMGAQSGYKKLTIKRNNTTDARYSIDYGTDTIIATNLSTASLPAYAWGQSQIIYADWVFVRKYSYPEPTETDGTEQTIPASQATVFYIQPTTGNVGIGTTNPGVALDVNGTIRSKTGVFSTTGAVDLIIKGDTSGSHIYLKAGLGTTNDLFVDGSTHRVGIGTNDPGIYKLNVNGKLYANEGIQLGSTEQGTYNPSPSGFSGNGALSAHRHGSYTRIGDWVQVNLHEYILMDRSGSMTFQVDLPIASNLTDYADISGVLMLTGAQRGGGIVWYNASYPTKARVQIQTTSQAGEFNCEMAISFRYKVK